MTEIQVPKYPKPFFVKIAGPMALAMGGLGTLQGFAALFGAFHFSDVPKNFFEIAAFFEALSKAMLPIGILYLVIGYLFIKNNPHSRWSFVGLLAMGVAITYSLSFWAPEVLQAKFKSQVGSGITMTLIAAWYFFVKKNVVSYYSSLRDVQSSRSTAESGRRF